MSTGGLSAQLSAEESIAILAASSIPRPVLSRSIRSFADILTIGWYESMLDDPRHSRHVVHLTLSIVWFASYLRSSFRPSGSALRPEVREILRAHAPNNSYSSSWANNIPHLFTRTPRINNLSTERSKSITYALHWVIINNSVQTRAGQDRTPGAKRTRVLHSEMTLFFFLYCFLTRYDCSIFHENLKLSLLRENTMV